MKILTGDGGEDVPGGKNRTHKVRNREKARLLMGYFDQSMSENNDN